MLRKLLIFAVLVIVAVGVTLLWAYWGAVFSVAVNHKVVALTYDDGPNPPHTAAMLAVLNQHNVKATFFVKGRNVEAFPDELLAVAQAGHEIGNHSYHHRPMISLDRGALRTELLRTNAIIEAVIGYRPSLFRPPYGAQGIGLKGALEDLDMTSIIANASGLDWELTDADQIAAKVLKSIKPGSIIMLHDGHADIEDPSAQNSRAATVAATVILIETLRSQGYSFATVGELMAMNSDL